MVGWCVVVEEPVFVRTGGRRSANRKSACLGLILVVHTGVIFASTRSALRVTSSASVDEEITTMHKLLVTQVLCYSASAIVVSFANGLSLKVSGCTHEGRLAVWRLASLYRQSASGCTFKATNMLRRSVGDPPWRRGYEWFMFSW